MASVFRVASFFSGGFVHGVVVPPVMAGMDKAEALAWVSRLFDAAAAGAVIWGDPLLVQRFLTQCSRTGSEETIRG